MGSGRISGTLATQVVPEERIRIIVGGGRTGSARRPRRARGTGGTGRTRRARRARGIATGRVGRLLNACLLTFAIFHAQAGLRVLADAGVLFALRQERVLFLVHGVVGEDATANQQHAGTRYGNHLGDAGAGRTQVQGLLGRGLCGAGSEICNRLHAIAGLLRAVRGSGSAGVLGSRTHASLLERWCVA